MKTDREYCEETHEITRLWRIACNYWRRPNQAKKATLQRALKRGWPHVETQPSFYDDER